jgi:hypothetical protein
VIYQPAKKVAVAGYINKPISRFDMMILSCFVPACLKDEV